MASSPFNLHEPTETASLTGITAKKSGQVVVLRINHEVQTAQATGYVTVGTLPTQYRPSQSVIFMGMDSRATSASELPLYMRVETDGQVQWFANAARLSAGAVGNVAYII